ncbi:cell division protein FtsK [Ligilactobacillus salitolerans]|uniref:Cell division protein FtsK n=1 Tax=Ligilactobacillus salitolerans TaxID=1808352 RepID=A0A401ISI1_9LACO|nr:DNA translocase FtsK [Ligilactobacillus salitolerans]GBG94474.1 cell division protein FtsK [Ligilactobacillus salitolerans]
MKHYDGPAFYRVQRGPKKQMSTPEKFNRKKDAHVHRSVAQQDAQHEVRVQVSQTAISSRPFRPSYIPPSILNRSQSKKAAPTISYPRLYQELHKKAETYFWLSDQEDGSEPTFDLTADLQSKANQPAKTAAQGEDQKGPAFSSTQSAEADQAFSSQSESEVILPTETFLPQHLRSGLDEKAEDLNDGTVQAAEVQDQLILPDENQAEKLTYLGEKPLDLDEAATHQPQVETKPVQTILAGPKEPTEVFVPKKEQQELSPAISPEKAEQSDSKNDEKEHTELVIRDQQPQRIEPKERALNRSFADILDFEQNDQRNLSLFSQHESLVKDTKQAATEAADASYQFPGLELLPEPVVDDDPQLDEWVLKEADTLNETLQAFHVNGTVKDWTIGPTVTQFEITLGRGVKVNKVTNLTDDLKLALAAKDIRIEAPIPGKSSIGIEIPNRTSRPVMLKEVLQSQAFQSARSPLTVALGVDLFGKPRVTNLKKMPHGLIAGATGSGKSVFINSLLISLLYKAKPSEVKLLLIDPKAVEMAPYQKIPHLLAPVVSDPQSAAAALKWVVKEMEERYERLAASGARNIDSFNEKAAAAGDFGLKMPYIVIVIDELADLMMAAASEVQDYIARITAKARAAGIHLLIATQRPSVDVVTGTIKNNIPTRVAFMVSSQVDSRTILDSAGAERLLGKGDLLYLGNGASQALRLQGTFIDEEVDRVTDFVRAQGQPQYAFDPDGLKEKARQSENEDELMPQVLNYIVNEDAVSTSKLQRVFSVGYNRAASIVEDLENKQYISGAKGSKPRDVFLTPERLAKIREN